ncbi:MAG TPA: diadenylate cyclase CdaA [Acidobacteriota bacterium]
MWWLSRWTNLPAFSWADLLQILIVAVILYRLLLFFRGTRAVQISLGILLVILFKSFAATLGLETLHWLLTVVLGSLGLVVVIVFQPEIRRALATFGRGPFFTMAARPESAGMIGELIEALKHFMETRTGALIAIERQVGLKDFAERGIQLDAKISYHLLLAIFNTKSPLHDGAVIMRGDRIAAASCFLNLTRNPSLDPELGTRHRAAIGLTEESDALVLVVSEETGKLSIALGGKLQRRVPLSSVRRVLEEFAESAAPRSARLSELWQRLRSRIHPTVPPSGGDLR